MGIREVGFGNQPPRIGLITLGWPRSAAIGRRIGWLDRHAQAIIPVFFALFAGSAAINILVGLLHEYRPSAHALDMDEQEYYSLSGQILAGHWDLGSRRTLLYPLIIAGLRLIDSDFLFLQIAISTIAALAAPLLFLVVRRLSGSAGLGLVAGILLALWPMQLFLATSLYSETVALPCFLLFLLALPPGARARRGDGQVGSSPGGAILAGLALGATAHIRTMYLLFLPFALIIPFLEERSLRRAARTALLAGLGFALMVLPWSWWMSSRHGQLIILTANGGETLAGGLNPRLAAMTNTAVRSGNRQIWVGPGKWLVPGQTGYLAPADYRLPYETMSRVLQQRTFAWIAAHPAEALRIELCKLGYMWGFYPWRGEAAVKLLAGNLQILALLGFALGIFLRSPARWLGLARLWTVPLFTSAVCLVSWGSWRFRQPADAALLAFCVIAAGLARHRKPGATAP